jgi:hypothetical protein
MKRNLTVVLAVLVVLSLVVAAPVSAEQPLRGVLDTHFNLGFGDTTTPCPHITWAGNVELDGELYGLAWTPLGPPKIVGQSFHVDERWMIYESPFAFEGEDVFTECGQHVAMWGDEKAVESLANLHAVGNGQVDWVDPDGPFDTALEGRNTHWSGFVSDDLLHFPGTFRINR